MRDIAQILRKIVSAVSEDINKQSFTFLFNQSFEKYLSILKPSLIRYRHHLIDEEAINNQELKLRFKHETAQLHVLTKVLLHKIPMLTEYQFFLWPVEETQSPFNWYTFPSNLSTSIDELVVELMSTDDPELIFSQLSYALLNEASKRYLGEFYTPLPLARHLIALSGLQSSEIVTGKKVVDPACGGGIILTSIANKIITEASKGKNSPQQILTALSQNLYGFDIQPFAVILTKTLLIYGCFPLLAKNAEFLTEPIFPNIKLLDPLATHGMFWGTKQSFDYIIGNPPFMSVKKEYLDYIQDYEEVLYGHPNLYQLFLWWAVKSANPQGIISFLLPQSLLAGNYFKNLRNALSVRTSLFNITRMIDRKGVVGEADHQMMAVSFRVDGKSPKQSDITIRVTRNGNDIEQVSPYKVSHSHVVQHIGEAKIWIVSDNLLDYEITAKLEKKCTSLAKLRQIFSYGNGGYVWNQHKELIQSKQDEGTLPLISAASIEPYRAIFPYLGSHPTQERQFSLVDDTISYCIHSGLSILIQRTTPRKVGRRLIAGMLPVDFHHQYPKYFLENHVNYIKIKCNNEDNYDLLYGLMGWLNSDIINFVFQLRNGNTQISIYELEMLPINLELIKDISDKTRSIFSTSLEIRNQLIVELNNDIFNWLGLDISSQTRILSVLSRKEKAEA